MRKTLYLLLILLYHSSFSQSSYSVFQGGEHHTGVHTQQEFQNLKDVKWKFKTEGKIFSSPAVAEGVIYIGSEDGNLYAIKEESGMLIWKFKTNGAVHSSPMVFDSIVYFGSFDGYYYAIEAKSGKEIWKFRTGGEKWIGGEGYFGWKPVDQFSTDPWQYFLSSVVIDPFAKEPVVYFGSSDSSLYALNSKTGALKWKFQTGGAIHSTPAIYKGKVYVGSWDSNIYAVNAEDGKEVWKFETGKKTGMTGIQASPTVHDDKIYIGSRDANFYALDAATGKMIWKYPAENSWILTTAAVKGGEVFIGTSDSFSLIALDSKTGIEKYRIRGSGYVYSSPAIVGNTGYFADFTGKVYSVDLAKRKLQSKFQTEGSKKGGSKVLNDKGEIDYKVFSGKDLSIYQNFLETIDQLYSLGSFVSSPAIGHGVLYIGSADGHLYALNLSGERKPAKAHLNK